MSIIPDEIIEQVRDAADLVSLLGESVELKRTGSDYRGPCPFHGGTHRNFAVIPKKGQYYCFVCKASGDVFSYFMKRFGMDYPTAVRHVAQRTGITIPEHPTRAGPDPREPLFTAVAAAQDWFARQLREHPDAAAARQYLVERGYDPDALQPFDLGYAPRGSGLLSAMTQLGIQEQILLEVGLVVPREDGSLIPKFRGRLLFPIQDLRGRVVGFGGRLLGPGEPKYLNSPETPIFHKGGLLYNLHQAKQAIRKEEAVIVVEGYFDVLRLALAGCDHVVAPLGTALTAEQSVLLKRLTPLAILLLDSDTAGLRATFRAGDELLRHEMRVRVATMPVGEDPDTLVRKGGLAALQPVLRDAVDLMERKIQILDLRGWFGDLEHRREALDRLLPTIRAARDPITRELYLSLVAERAGVSKDVLLAEVRAAEEREVARAGGEPRELVAGPGPRIPIAARPQRPPREGARTEYALLRVLMRSEAWLKRARTEVHPDWFEEPVCRELYQGLSQSEGGKPTLPEGLSALAERAWSKLEESGASLTEEQADQIYAEACQILEARPVLRQYEELVRRIGATTGDERSGLIEQRERLRQQIQDRYPGEFTRRHSQRKWKQNPSSKR